MPAGTRSFAIVSRVARSDSHRFHVQMATVAFTQKSLNRRTISSRRYPNSHALAFHFMSAVPTSP